MNATLYSTDPLTQQIRSLGINNWDQLTEWIRALPYGRNSDRNKPELVLAEMRGSCSSKHGFLRKIAQLNGLEEVKLILGMYLMTEENTPGIAPVLTNAGINGIPEAHCYLSVSGERVDFTTISASINRIRKDLLEEQEIHPEQVADYKPAFHTRFLRQWLSDTGSRHSFEEIWTIRERCIAQLTKQ